MGHHSTLKRSVIMLVLASGLLGSLIIGIAIGAVYIPPAEIGAILLSHVPVLGERWATNRLPEHDIIIMTMRFPRVILAGLAGAGLALAGATFQGLFRNPMADPYVIGVSSGAALGAVVSIMIQTAWNIPMRYGIPVFAFVFAIVTIALVYNLARVGGKVPVMTLLLAGIAINSLLSAVESLCLFFSGEQLHQIVFWLMGGFSGAGWDYVFMFLPYGVIGTAIIFVFARELNALLLGEESAQHLGVEVERVKRYLLVAAALLTGACVSVSGMIAFVGLVIPHIVRMLFGSDHRILLPSVALIGAIFLLLADSLSRIIIAPSELPVGIITALVGGPFFILLLRRQKNALF